MPSLIVLSLLLLAVVIFALQNAQAVTVRFLSWQLQSSVAVVALAATAAGVLIAGLFGLASRLLRWKRNRPADGSGASGSASSDPGHSASLDAIHQAGRRGSKVP
jgi:uncharacterized integral membrane protein